MRKIVRAILFLAIVEGIAEGMVGGSARSLSASEACVRELYGSPYGFAYLVEPPRDFISVWSTVAGSSLIWEYPVIQKGIPLRAPKPIYLTGSVIVRGQYNYDEFAQRYAVLSRYKSGQLYLMLLANMGHLLSQRDPKLSQEYFTLMVLNRRDWHEIGLHNLALYTARQLVPALPSVSDLFAIRRQNGTNDAATEREWFALIVEALEKIRPQLMGIADPLQMLLSGIRDDHKFRILSEDGAFNPDDAKVLYEFSVEAKAEADAETHGFDVVVEVSQNSHLLDGRRAPFMLLDMALYDDYLDVFENQAAMVAYIAASSEFVPAELLMEEERDAFSEPDTFLYASSATAIELSPRQADLLLDLIRQFKNFGLELVP